MANQGRIIMRQYYVRFFAVIFLLVFVFGVLGCGSKTSPEYPHTVKITERGGNQFEIAIKKSAFSESDSTRFYLKGNFTSGSILLTEVEEDDEIWLKTLVWLAGCRQLKFVDENGNGPMNIPEDEPGYNSYFDVWEVRFFQASYEFLEPGEYVAPVPIKLEIALPFGRVKINVSSFHDPLMSFPIHFDGLDKDPQYPDEEGFVTILLSPEDFGKGFNLFWENPSGEKVRMELDKLRKEGIPCIEGDPALWVIRKPCPGTTTCCCEGQDFKCEECKDCSSCPSCPECVDSNSPIIDPITGLQYYDNNVWGDPEPNRHCMFQYVDGKWILYFLKSDLPEDQWSDEMFLKGMFNNWKLTIPLVDSVTFVGWVQTENPIAINSGKQRFNWGCQSGEEFYYAWHSDFQESMFYQEWEGAHSYGAVFPEDGDKLVPWD